MDNKPLFPIPMVLAACVAGATIPIVLLKLKELKIEVSAAGYRGEDGVWMGYEDVARAILS